MNNMRPKTKQLNKKIISALRSRPEHKEAFLKIERLYNNNVIKKITTAEQLINDLIIKNINVNNKIIRKLNKYKESDQKPDLQIKKKEIKPRKPRAIKVESKEPQKQRAAPIEIKEDLIFHQEPEPEPEPEPEHKIYSYIDDNFNVAINSKLNARLKVNVLNMAGDNKPFIHFNIPLIVNNIIKLSKEVPLNYNYGFSIQGFLISPDGKGPEITIFKSYIDNKLDAQLERLKTSSRLNMASERYYIISNYQTFYEIDQGGSFKKINYDDMKEYNIYSPSSVLSCGQECLKYYNIEAHKKGFLTLSDMKSLSPIPVVDHNINENEFILLRDNHYVRCIKKTFQKQQMKEARLTNSEKKLASHIEKLNKKKICIYDVETYGTNQIPIIIGFTFDGVNFNYYFGPDCVQDFIKNLDCDFLVGFNSNKFDNILLRSEIVKQGYIIKDVVRSANSIIKSFISKGEKSFECVDILNFTSGSLRKNLKNFNCKISKGDLDYNIIKPDMTEANKNLMIEYLKLDVLGTYELYKILDAPFHQFNLSLLELYTLSQGAYKIIREEWKKKGIMQERLSRGQDQFFREAIYGGRCEVFKKSFISSEYKEIKQGIKKYDDINDYLLAPDVNSLYPSVMRDNKYPIGAAIMTTKEQPGKCGIYKCVVEKPKNLLYPVLCSNGEYNLIDNEGNYTYYDICEARKEGYKIKIISGFYWEQSEYIFKDYIDNFYQIKKNSIKGSPQYANSKLMMNGLYGKTMQRDKNIINYTVSDAEEIVNMKKGKNLNKFSAVFIGDVGYFEYEEDLQEMTDKKPHIGAYILSYSKKIMNEAFKKVTPYYTDTDSIYIHSSEKEKLKWGPELGEFSNDVSGKIICAYFIAKKLKYCEVITSENKIESFYTGKGCDISTMTKKHFKDMIKGDIIENITKLNFKRCVRLGTIEKRENIIKNIKMNDGKRIFKDGVSVPYGYVK